MQINSVRKKMIKYFVAVFFFFVKKKSKQSYSKKKNIKKKMQQEQLAMLQKAMESQKKVEALQEENNKLREQIAKNQLVFDRLSKISLASASLLSSVDSSAQETEMSSLKCLSKLEESTAVVPDEEKPEDDQVKAIVGKYLNHLLVNIVDFAEQNQGPIDIFSMEELENTMAQLFQFAETKGIIPERKETEGWKKSVITHKALFQKLKDILSQKSEQ